MCALLLYFRVCFRHSCVSEIVLISSYFQGDEIYILPHSKKNLKGTILRTGFNAEPLLEKSRRLIQESHQSIPHLLLNKLIRFVRCGEVPHCHTIIFFMFQILRSFCTILSALKHFEINGCSVEGARYPQLSVVIIRKLHKNKHELPSVASARLLHPGLFLAPTMKHPNLN